MPSVVADSINEAFFNEIGDNILECDGDTIVLLEDYREDIAQLLEESKSMSEQQTKQIHEPIHANAPLHKLADEPPKEERKKVPRRITPAILNSLKGGVVPRIGLPYITVGRKNEIEALLHDVDIITKGGASFRFIVDRYGSGKSFLLQTIRNYVMERGFIVADADLSSERRLQGTRGQGLATYQELIGNLSTKTKPEGGALTLVLDRWISSVQAKAVQETGLEPGNPGLTKAVDGKIYTVTSAVS